MLYFKGSWAKKDKDTVVLNMFIKLYISLFFWHGVGQMINQQINQQ